MMSRIPKYNTILKQAEEVIKKATENKTIGYEIENGLAIWALDKKGLQEYKTLYRRAKKENPEIWESTVHNLPSEAFYNNKDFFDLLFILSEVQFVADCYPDKKAEIKIIFNHSFQYIEAMYYFLQRFLTENDKVLEFNKLLEKIAKGGKNEN